MDKEKILKQPFFVFQNKVIYLREIINSTDVCLVEKGNSSYKEGSLLLISNEAPLVIGCTKRGMTLEKIQKLKSLINLLKEIFSKDDFVFSEFRKILLNENNYELIRPMNKKFICINNFKSSQFGLLFCFLK